MPRFRDAGLAALILATGAIPLLDDSLPPALLLQSLPIMPYVAAAVLIALVGGLVWIGWRFTLILASVSMIAAMGIGLSAPASLAVAGQTLRVATWNTEYWDQTEGPQALGSALSLLDGDVLLLQEHLYWDDDLQKTIPISQSDLLKRCCGYLHVWEDGELVIASRKAGTHLPSGNRFIQTVRIDGTVFVNVHVPVHVTRSHPIWSKEFWSYGRTAARSRSTVFARLEAILAQDGQFVVGGDFNSTLLMPQMRSIASKARFVDGPLTFPNGPLQLWRLDNLGDTHARMVDCTVRSIAQNLSDHLPVMCTFVLAGAP